MLNWIRRLVARTEQCGRCEWEFEPYLSTHIRHTLDHARKDGDQLAIPRVVLTTVSFPDLRFAGVFRDRVPTDWKTMVRKSPDTADWECECKRCIVPDAQALIDQTRVLWCLAVAIHPVLSSCTTIYDSRDGLMWRAYPPTLDYRSDEG